VDATGLADADTDKGAGGSATVGSAGKPLWEAELSFPNGSSTRGRGGNAAAIPPTAKASSSGGCRASGRTCVRAVFHGLFTRTEGIPSLPASRGDVEDDEGKEGDDDVVTQGFPAVPTETLENVLALTACVTGGGSNREGVEAAFTDGEGLRGDAELHSCNSPGLPLPASRARASRALPYASCTTESAVPAPEESRSHTERIPPPAEPNKSEDVERAGRDPGPNARGLGTRTGAGVGVGAGEDAGDGGRGCCCGSRTGAKREALVSGRPGSSSRF
jgi:hypothetical protein